MGLRRLRDGLQEGDGFSYTGYGDHQVTLYSDGGYVYIKNGNEVVSQADYLAGAFPVKKRLSAQNRP